MRLPILLFSVLAFMSTAVVGQNPNVKSEAELCDDRKNNYGDRKSRNHHCEVQEFTIKDNREIIKLDAGKNGGVEVVAWDKDEILVQATVQTWSRSQDRSKELANDIKVNVRRTIEADVPKTKNREGVSVSYTLYVPKNSNLDLETFNGGITIEEVNGDITFQALNGGVRLYDLSGDVQGETTNGGVSVYLNGKSWEGSELNVHTTNGGVTIHVPENYNADLTTGTVNGGMKFDFPITVKGTFSKRVSTVLGDGGNPIKITTTNGSVRVKERSFGLSKL